MVKLVHSAPSPSSKLTGTSEISRLQHSLERLRSTQVQLQEFLKESESPDADLSDAFNENKNVIASQEERIQLLRHALELKGGSVASNPHYAPQEASLPSVETSRNYSNANLQHDTSDSIDDSAGVFL
ncbi:hypothetical protein FRC03_000322 [Tulasnella sp. 419]|nr:hypothetical protein FRC03_000322 [Tulasnella sp. 419]